MAWLSTGPSQEVKGVYGDSVVSRGHVFVVHGDLTQLACDDVLVPTDTALNVSEH